MFEETLRTLQKNPEAVKRAMARPELFETHQTKVREELAHCIRMAREGRAQAAANARAVAAAVRNNMPPFLSGPGGPGGLGMPGLGGQMPGLNGPMSGLGGQMPGLGLGGPGLGGLGLGQGGPGPGLPFGMPNGLGFNFRPPTSMQFPFRSGAGGPWLAGPAGVAPQPPPFPSGPPPAGFPMTSQCPPDFGTQTFGTPLGGILPPVSSHSTARLKYFSKK